MDKKQNNSVLYISIAVVLAIALWGLISPEAFGKYANSLFGFLVDKFGWFYLLAMFTFVVFSLGLAFSRYGNIKLGPDDAEPEFKYLTWFGMLFGCGMGIGLVFWGVAEPLYHFTSPPFGITAGSSEAADFAMRTSFFHWGFHAWANYAVIGLALAYFQFRKNKPGLISTIFIPLLGEERVKGPVGKTIDVLAIFATAAGVATSLGMGILQINSGLNFMFDVPTTKLVQLILIIVIAVIYIWTAVTGIQRGIKWLANINLVLCGLILLLVFVAGPTVKMLNGLVSGFANYVNFFIADSFRLSINGDNSWIGGWTVFYWAWWIAWAPFVGTFIARISKGRTIKEFVIGVTFVPALASFIWFSGFGTLGLNLGMEEAAKAIAAGTETALFAVVQHYPLGQIISLIAVVLLFTFFITSANSATFVLGMFSSNGDLEPNNTVKTLWGILQALLATALLFAGGLKALQIGSIAAAFPFAIIMLFACVSIYKALVQEYNQITSK
ncbi:glycine betaine transporter [Thermosyntropha lipolytica DSM 11003]|uniref:Glycine betaine transporter n=1 Tax=Thermosyntropha lipolytica DSM 11003 TaxID=1123382 RepID=A0A1M5QP89_9FIRM|nr:BCCT family transporter [Thermosyntropha lipolytica]SHH15639.1 glycine betaine transporter [Thermosyntropha lipolytica DSM 11003]